MDEEIIADRVADLEIAQEFEMRLGQDIAQFLLDDDQTVRVVLQGRNRNAVADQRVGAAVIEPGVGIGRILEKAQQIVLMIAAQIGDVESVDRPLRQKVEQVAALVAAVKIIAKKYHLMARGIVSRAVLGDFFQKFQQQIEPAVDIAACR